MTHAHYIPFLSIRNLSVRRYWDDVNSGGPWTRVTCQGPVPVATPEAKPAGEGAGPWLGSLDSSETSHLCQVWIRSLVLFRALGRFSSLKMSNPLVVTNDPKPKKPAMGCDPKPIHMPTQREETTSGVAAYTFSWSWAGEIE